MEEKINIEAIINNIAQRSNYSRAEVKDFLDIIISKFKEYLRADEKIEIRGLGTFYTKEHKGRYVRLRTKIIDSKNHFITLFKESKVLQRSVNLTGEKNGACKS